MRINTQHTTQNDPLTRDSHFFTILAKLLSFLRIHSLWTQMVYVKIEGEFTSCEYPFNTLMANSTVWIPRDWMN